MRAPWQTGGLSRRNLASSRRLAACLLQGLPPQVLMLIIVSCAQVVHSC